MTRPAIARLFLVTLGELAALPFHVVAFLARRRRIRRDIRGLLEECGRRGAAA